MRNLKNLGKVLDKKEQMSINGGGDRCGKTLCYYLCVNGLRRCGNLCNSDFYLPC